MYPVSNIEGADVLWLMQIATVLMGVFGAGYALFWSFYFWRTNRLGGAVSFMLIGESTTLIVATAFAALSLLGVLAGISPWVQMFMRWVIFLVTIASTVHLSRTVHCIIAKSLADEKAALIARLEDITRQLKELKHEKSS